MAGRTGKVRKAFNQNPNVLLRGNSYFRNRLDMMHHATGLILGGDLHVAELPKKVGRVLDAGTGTGIWAVDFAE